MEVLKLPHGELRIKAKRPINSIFGLTKDKTAGNVTSIDEMNQAVVAGWTGSE
mgnify:FL=1